MTEQPVDVAAVVTEIEAEVARKRAAGEYPEELLARLRAEFSEATDERQPLDEIAHLQTVRPLESTRPGLGRAVVAVKKALRRSMAWYVQPIAEAQSHFNFALLRELQTYDERLRRLETATRRPFGTPAPEAGLGSRTAVLTAARVETLVAALRELPSGPVLVLQPPDAVLLAELRRKGLPVEAVTADDALVTAARLAGVRCHEEDPLSHLEARGSALAAVVAPGLMPLLAPAELLRLAPAAAAALKPGGVLYLDAPGEGVDPATMDPGARRPVSQATAVLLCEAAGLSDLDAAPLPDAPHPWYRVVGRRPAA